jgi:calcineurin-like phosphoesterase family protein
MMSWNGISKGSWMIHGHIHNNVNSDYWQLVKVMPNLLNAGVDINNFEPVSFNELEKNNQLFKESEGKENSDEFYKIESDADIDKALIIC